VRVADTGSGIQADQLPHIFDRFHQVDGIVSRVQEGTGIGLALVKELVSIHGGEITVESAPGEGSMFNVYLRKGVDHFDEIFDTPYSDESEISHGPMVEMAVFEDIESLSSGDGAVVDASVEAGGSGRPQIVVVDDSRDIRNYVVGCLSGRYTVATASDGVEALEIIRRRPPDLILSDVMMPRMDGLELCRAVKGDEELRHIPIIMLTSKASVDARIEGFQSGSDDYLSKPFNSRELCTRIDNLLRSRKQSAELLVLNRALVEKNEALREATELKSELLSIASHEVKNPLTSIREFARILKGEVGESSHLNELLDHIYSSSNEMLQLVTQLLDSDALEGRQLLLDKRPVDVTSLVEIIVHRNRAQAKAKGQTIVFEAPPRGEIMVMADFERLREAMDNVVSNAVKYSPLDQPIHISLEKADRKVRFLVRDEGPGLTRDDKKRLFGRFQRLSAQPTGGESSNGLGLSIVKQIIELHGGNVSAKSRVGRGTTFIIELDACTAVEIVEFEGLGAERSA
jgi:signal transduction histidine kinase